MTISKLTSAQGLTTARVLVTGATGRLGQFLMKDLKGEGLQGIAAVRTIMHPKVPHHATLSHHPFHDHHHAVHQVSLCSKTSEDEMKRLLSAHHINVIVNAAAASKGDPKAMMDANTHMPMRLAKAAHDLGIQFIQASTTAALIPDLSLEKTPYAYSKQQAERQLLELDNVTVARIDALLGDPSDTLHIGHMAGIRNIWPLAIHFKGSAQIFQPTSYEAASTTIAKLASERINGINPSSADAIINIAGAPITVSDFVRLLNKGAVELHVDPQDLMKIASIVENGSLTPEFLQLAINASRNPVVHDNTTFKRLLGDKKLPTPEELALTVSKQMTAPRVLSTMAGILGGVKDKQGLIVQGIKLIQAASLLPKSNSSS